MSEWREFTLGEIGEIFDGPHATPERRDDGPYFLNIASLTNGRLDLASSDHVDEEDFSRWTRRVTPRTDDLLFSYETRLGEAALMPQGVRACLGRRMALLRVTHPEVDPRFMLYLWLSPSFKALIDANTIHGATVNRIPLSRMDGWRLSLPPYKQQRAIAEALGALDDKIEANRKLAATAAQLTSSLYRWALSLPGRRRGRFFDYFTVEYGTAYRGAFFEEHGEGRPLIRVRDLKTYSPRTWTTEVVSGEAIVHPGDILVGMDADFSPTAWQGQTALLNQRVCRVASDYSRAFTLEAVRAPLQHIEGYKTGTTVIHLNKRDLMETHVELPSHEAARAFDGRASALLEEQTAVFAENRTLVALRDTLLPKLMSGQLRVGDAVELVGS